MFERLKAKLTEAKESYRLSGEQLEAVAKEMPYPRGYWRMSDAEILKWRREQRKGGNK